MRVITRLKEHGSTGPVKFDCNLMRMISFTVYLLYNFLMEIFELKCLPSTEDLCRKQMKENIRMTLKSKTEEQKIKLRMLMYTG